MSIELHYLFTTSTQGTTRLGHIMRMRGVHLVVMYVRLSYGSAPSGRGEVCVAMDLLGSIMGSMDKPPTPSERERKMQKGEYLVRTPLRTVVR